MFFEKALSLFLEDTQFKKLMVINDGGAEFIILVHQDEGGIDEIIMKVNDED